MTKNRIRLLAGAVLALALTPGTWVRSGADTGKPTFFAQSIELADLPPEIAHDFGPFTLAEAWDLQGDTHRNHSYSALALSRDGTLFLASDKGDLLRMPLPTKAGVQSGASLVSLNRGDPDRPDWHLDIEAIVLDEEADSLWLSVENFRSIMRFDLALKPTGWLSPPAMQRWTETYGGEAMVQLDDGRFLIIPEGHAGGVHLGLLFPDDPVNGAEPAIFRLEMPGEFRPTEMVLLPDGGALILGRDFDLPFKFETVITYLDLAAALEEGGGTARTIARITDRALADNYEGMVIGPDTADGRATLWLVSDDNKMQFMQRTILLKLEFSPADFADVKR